MQDLREKFAVVREQSSWEDTDPFYCGQCQSLHNPTSPPYNTIPVDPENRGEDRVSTPSPPQGTWEENLGNSPQDHLEQTGCSDSCCLAGPAMGETTGKIASLPVESRGHGKVRLDDAMVTGRETRRPSPPSVAIAAEISTHLHKVDKYPLDCARLCRFAQFLTDNGLLGEAYEVRREDALRGSWGMQHSKSFIFYRVEPNLDLEATSRSFSSSSNARRFRAVHAMFVVAAHTP